MEKEQFLEYMRQGNPAGGGSEAHQWMHHLAEEAMQQTAELNNAYHEPKERRELFSRIIGKPVDDTFSIFPPFYTECGKNISVGKHVFINCCCHFQDQGGIDIGDGTLIGSHVVIATINHGMKEAERKDNFPAPVRIGKNVWIGSVSYTHLDVYKRQLGMDPIYLGINKKSNRQLKRTNRKMSEYGLQLREKQKAKFIYGVLEKPFRNYYAKAKQMEGMTGANLMILLESRLDNVMFRMGFARTRKEARQIVDHKHVLVNGKQVNIPSYLIKAGDTIEIKEKHKGSQRYKDILEVTGGNLIPDWLEVDAENLKGTVKELPTREAIDVPVDEMLIVELYSK